MKRSKRLLYDWDGISMRTSIVIDDKLLRDALRATGLKTSAKSRSLACGRWCAYENKRRFGGCGENSCGRVISTG
jgi:hypothetical protein